MPYMFLECKTTELSSSLFPKLYKSGNFRVRNPEITFQFKQQLKSPLSTKQRNLLDWISYFMVKYKLLVAWFSWLTVLTRRRVVFWHCYHSHAFVRLRKATIRFVMSVRPSVSTEELSSHRQDFREIWWFFWKSVQKIHVLLQYDTNSGDTCVRTDSYCWQDSSL